MVQRVTENHKQNIYKVDIYSEASTTSEKWLGYPGTSGVSEFVQKYLECWQTFTSLTDILELLQLQKNV